MQIPAHTTASGLAWVPRAEDARLVTAMAQQHGISPLLAEILAGRGVGLDDVPGFLAPSLRDSMPDPFHLRDMEKAAARLARAIAQGETIAAFGDYDVDGATSTALLWHYLTPLGVTVLPYIPDRQKEGYGPNEAAFRQLIAQGAGVIVTVDCGTLAHAPIAMAQAAGVDVIVLDHHLSSGALPPAHAVVNPNRVDETSPLRHLAAVGVTFLTLVALNKTLREQGFFDAAEAPVNPSPQRGEVGRGAWPGSAYPDRPHPSPPPMGEGVKGGGRSQREPPARDAALSIAQDARPPKQRKKEPNLLVLLDLVALGTVCDVMPLTGLNRAFVAQGLKLLASRRQRGLAALADVARLNEAPGAYHLGFVYGPRINAGGRVGEAGLGVRLLTCEEEMTIRACAERLHQHNAERQAIEAGVLEQALEQAARQANAPVLVAAGEGWHPGVIGIVAGRLKEKFARPAAVIALDGAVGKGSARSVAGADIGAAVHAAQLAGHLTAGGGHAMAAGFSLARERVEDFRGFLCAHLEQAVQRYGESRMRRLDGWISCGGATAELIADFNRAAPYGLGNPGPRFGIRDAQILHRRVMKEKHLRLVLGDAAGGRLNAVAFHVGDSQLGAWLAAYPRLHLAGELSLNRWQGQETPQFIIEDAALPA